MRSATPLRTLSYAALVSGLLFAASCQRADVVAGALTSAEDQGQGDAKNAATADLAEAAAPQDVTASASLALVGAAELRSLTAGCFTRTYDAAARTVGFGTPTINNPLSKKFARGCARHFVAGTIEVTNSKAQTMRIDYDPSGTAACDNIATVTMNGRTRTIYLK